MLALLACQAPSGSEEPEMSKVSESEPNTQVQTVSDLSSEEYATRGILAADPDFPGLKSLCGEPSRLLTPERVGSREWKMPAAIKETQVFDNLYFLGNAFTSAWAINTNDGIILIDALWHPREAERFIEGGLKKLGLDPADIKVMVLSHGHGDHTGGARYLYDKYKMQVVMGKTDWDYLSGPNNIFDFPGWNDIPTPDVLVSDRNEITLGDTTIQVVSTPGHTMGTVSTIFNVSDGEDQHSAVIWGGTGYNFGPKLNQYEAYATSADNMYNEVLDEGINIFLSNHVRRDGSDKKIETLTKRGSGDPHPFILGPERTSKAFATFRDCALSQAQKLKENAN